MDKQLRIAEISRLAYRLLYKPKLYRYDLTKRFPLVAKKARQWMGRIIPDDDRLVCLPKNEIFINQEIKKSDNLVAPTEVIDHFIEKSGYRAVMNYCICRKSNDCKDYPVDLGCLFLGEAARKIHPDMHRSVTKKEAKAHIRRAREAGAVHLVGRAILDTFWLDIGPHDKLFTICNCCPCCCISLATPFLAPEMTDWFHKMPGVEVAVTGDCTGCGQCLDACIYGGLIMENEGAQISEHCRGCGRCLEACPQEAIALSMDPAAIQETIDFIAPTVDVT